MLIGACGHELVDYGPSDWSLVTVTAFTALLRDPVLLHANRSLCHVVFLSTRLRHLVCFFFLSDFILLEFILRLGLT